jgi:hypothetical protein
MLSLGVVTPAAPPLLQQSQVIIDNLPHKDIWDYVSIVSTVILAPIGLGTLLVVVKQTIATADAAKAAVDSVRDRLNNN